MPALGKHKREAETPGKNNNPPYHIVQITHHSFSMASSPAPLPVQLPGHLEHELVIVTDQLIDSTSHPDSIPSNQIIIPRPLHNLETNAFWDRPLLPQLFETSWQDMRTSPMSSCEPSSQASPPLYNRGRRSTTARPTTLGSISQTSMPSAVPSNSTSATLMASCYYAPMDLRTMMGGSPPSLSLAQMGKALLSSSNSWMMAEWWDLALEQEVSMMLTLLTSLLHHPSMTNLSNPSLTGSAPTSGATTPISIHSRRPSSHSMTGASLLRSSDTKSWTERLPHYRQSLTWWT